MSISMTKTRDSMELPIRALFLPYAVCVLSLGFLLVLKAIHFDFTLLPQQPSDIVFLLIFLELPHIVASHLMLIDREYGSFYLPKLAKSYAVAAVSLIGIWYFLGAVSFFAVYFIWTVYHVLKQQIGIGRIMNRQPSKLYEVWGYCLLAGSLILAAAIGYFRIAFDDISQLVRLASYVFALILPIFGYIVASQLKQQLGRWYLYANTAMYLSVLACFLMGAPFFVIFIPRIIHDMTAFMLYINHDANRNAETRRNILYRQFWFLPIWVATITLPIFFASFITFGYIPFALQFGVVLTVSHYLLESVVWRGTSLHRSSLKLSFK